MMLLSKGQIFYPHYFLRGSSTQWTVQSLSRSFGFWILHSTRLFGSSGPRSTGLYRDRPSHPPSPLGIPVSGPKVRIGTVLRRSPRTLREGTRDGTKNLNPIPLITRTEGTITFDVPVRERFTCPQRVRGALVVVGPFSPRYKSQGDDPTPP